jgi:hypothetical protein
LVLIVGAQSEHAAWALVYGLAERGSRRLVLVLPHDAAFATMQRVPWLTEESRPEIWLHKDSALQDAPAPERSRLDTIEAVRAHASQKSNGAGPAGELRAASTPKYLGEQSAGVRQLVERATSHPQLDAAHNQSTRSWLCAGQKFLSLDSGPGLVQVRAGIHDKQRMSAPDESVAPGQAVAPEQMEVLQQNVASAIAARIEPGARYCKSAAFKSRLAGSCHGPQEHPVSTQGQLHFCVAARVTRSRSSWAGRGRLGGGDRAGWGRAGAGALRQRGGWPHPRRHSRPRPRASTSTGRAPAPGRRDFLRRAVMVSPAGIRPLSPITAAARMTPGRRRATLAWIVMAGGGDGDRAGR